MKSGQNFRLSGEKFPESPSDRFSFHMHTGKAEGTCDVCVSDYFKEKETFHTGATGIGKTMATVFPAVKAVGEGLGDKLFI